MRSTRMTLALAALSIAVVSFAVACGDTAVTTPSPPPGGGGGTAADVTITMGNLVFAPSSTTVRVGQTVAWQNGDSMAHTASANSGAFDTGTIAPGGTSAAITMGTAGTFPYFCRLHPGMVGTLIVTP